MRKKEREITDQSQLEHILTRAQVMRLGMAKDGQPYVVPLSFAYSEGSVYFHCGRQGLKVDFLKANPKVCFEVDLDTQIVPAEKPCNFGARYQSLVGFGQAEFLAGEEEKTKALNILMRRYGGRDFEFTSEALAITEVVRIRVEHMTGKSARMQPA